jgi:hypothetical protein
MTPAKVINADAGDSKTGQLHDGENTFFGQSHVFFLTILVLLVSLKA